MCVRGRAPGRCEDGDGDEDEDGNGDGDEEGNEEGDEEAAAAPQLSPGLFSPVTELRRPRRGRRDSAGTGSSAGLRSRGLRRAGMWGWAGMCRDGQGWAGGRYRGPELGAGTGGWNRGVVPGGSTGGLYRGPVPGGGTGGRYRGAVPGGGTGGLYRGAVPGGGSGRRYRGAVPGAVPGAVSGGGTGHRYRVRRSQGAITVGGGGGAGPGDTEGSRVARGHRSSPGGVPAVPRAAPDTGSGAAAPPLPAAGGSDAPGVPGVCPHGHAGELRAEPGREALREAEPVRWQRGDLLELGPGHSPVGHPGLPQPGQGLPAPHPVPGGILQPAVHAGRLQNRRGAGENLRAVPAGQPRHADRFQVEETVLDKLKITFGSSTDFFGRVVVYHLGVLGERL